MSRRSRFLRIIYSLIGIVILLYSAYLVNILVMHLWHKADHGEHHAEPKGAAQYEAMMHGTDMQKQDAGYGNFTEAHPKYTFHELEEAKLNDSYNLCVSCHGDIPHSTKKETRAFLNMHSYFMGCETCHIKVDNGQRANFEWYSKITGERKTSMDVKAFLGDPEYKIIPVQNEAGSNILYSSDSMRDTASELIQGAESLSGNEKSSMLDELHAPMSKLENSVTCKDCHTGQYEEAYLPYKKLGYAERRIDQLIGNEVVGMINKYEKFIIPGFLAPKGE
ncbi:hypothetical protein [Limisalsivibrio acetivorans]|uniref:hypothetical protein n=1 Tax=Limisalsivibrio acetivorans TaxID=1304888 RepID=UPI000420EDAC|nr:hypothetical protein [Limisalsivibrio acetivorans]